LLLMTNFRQCLLLTILELFSGTKLSPVNSKQVMSVVQGLPPTSTPLLEGLNADVIMQRPLEESYIEAPATSDNSFHIFRVNPKFLYLIYWTLIVRTLFVVSEVTCAALIDA